MAKKASKSKVPTKAQCRPLVEKRGLKCPSCSKKEVDVDAVKAFGLTMKCELCGCKWFTKIDLATALGEIEKRAVKKEKPKAQARKGVSPPGNEVAPRNGITSDKKVAEILEGESRHQGPLNNVKREMFCRYVASGICQTRAAIKAGFGSTYQSSGFYACKLIKKPIIRARIQTLLDQATDDLMMGKQRLLVRAWTRAQATPDDFMEKMPDGSTRVNLENGPTGAIKSLKIKNTTDKDGKVTSEIYDLVMKDGVPYDRLFVDVQGLKAADKLDHSGVISVNTLVPRPDPVPQELLDQEATG